MNLDNPLYNKYLEISNNWPLDDWSITKECFDNIIEILPFGKTILEIGSGNSTKILSIFYNMISIESKKEWMNKYDSKYLYIPFKQMVSEKFGKTKWLDVDVLKDKLQNIDYDLIIVDAGADRIGIYDNIHIFKIDIPIIFDDTMNDQYLKCAELLSIKLNKKIETVQCKRNKKCDTWWDGKKYSILT